MDILSPVTNTHVKVNSVEEALWKLTRVPNGASEDQMPTPRTLEKTPPSPLHALIIGINKFKSERIVDLRGCVADADKIEEYLQDELNVPPNQIINLRDEQATRVAILRELNALRTRPSIRKGDPILIFFAGHGTRADTPIGWNAGSDKISLIVPHDCWSKDKNGVDILPIPDRTVGAILHGIAEQEDGSGKGNNITVIFDCCHSGSGTRVSEFTESRLERGFTMEEPIPASLDEGIWRSARAIAVAAGFLNAGAHSHVLLAACKETEVAHEENGRGAFTSALLRTLRGVATDKITYKEVMGLLPDIPKQIPQCEGYYVDRVLFNALSPSKGRVVYPVTQEGGNLIMQAGTIHGLTQDAKFAIYASRDFFPGESPLAIVMATTIMPFNSELIVLSPKDKDGPVLPAETPCFAFQSSMGEAEALRIHIPFSDEFIPAMRALAFDLELQQAGGTQATHLSDKANADLALSVDDDGYLKFDILDSLITAYGIHALYHTVMPDSRYILPALRSASHFFWHLRRSPEKNRLRSKVDVKVHALVEDDEAELDDDLMPPLVRNGDDLFRGGAVDVVADSKAKYGVTIRNKTSVPLHVWVFYFDCSDLSITEYYRSPTADQPILLPFGTLHIGYGAGGGRPFTYFLREGQDRDVGFIKLFISTEYVDLSSIAQGVPFVTDRAAVPPDVPVSTYPRPIWDTVIITVVQYGAASGLTRGT
ncbi:unnamed protein product [Peniophora sp. CBMAI 1063]|nr:unnamed protein product [Peniophora sp. CBMAI 1063]